MRGDLPGVAPVYPQIFAPEARRKLGRQFFVVRAFISVACCGSLKM